VGVDSIGHLFMCTDVIRESDALEGKVIVNWRTRARTDLGKDVCMLFNTTNSCDLVSEQRVSCLQTVVLNN